MREGGNHLSEADLTACSHGSLDETDGARIQAHLAASPECWRRVGEIRNLVELLSARYPPIDDPEAQAAILARTSAWDRPPRAARPVVMRVAGPRGRIRVAIAALLRLCR